VCVCACMLLVADADDGYVACVLRVCGSLCAPPQADYLHPSHFTMEMMEEFCVGANIPIMVVVRAPQRDVSTVKVSAVQLPCCLACIYLSVRSTAVRTGLSACSSLLGDCFQWCTRLHLACVSSPPRAHSRNCLCLLVQAHACSFMRIQIHAHACVVYVQYLGVCKLREVSHSSVSPPRLVSNYPVSPLSPSPVTTFPSSSLSCSPLSRLPSPSPALWLRTRPFISMH
jgi:hypothetical protein